MAESQIVQDGTTTIPPSGKVNNVRQQWLVFEDGALAHNEQEKELCREWLMHEDSALAHRLQKEEFGHKYEWNRKDRRTARKDVPLARLCETEEEERKQMEAMQRLEKNKELAEKDSVAAEKMMSEMILEEQRARIAREMQDQRVAQVLQESEKRKFEQKQRERALARERKRLERELASQTQAVLAGDSAENGHNVALEIQRGRRLRSDGKVEDLGDFSDFYIPPDTNMGEAEAKHLREMQDEELARLLQDQEHKRGGQVDKDKMRAIEAQDEELAMVMQEQEKLKVAKRQAKIAAKRQLSQPVYPEGPPQSGRYPPQRALSDRGAEYPPPGHYPPQDPRLDPGHTPHHNGHHHHRRPPVDGRMSPPLEHAPPVPTEVRTHNDMYENQRFHQERDTRSDRTRDRGREVESLQREAPAPMPAPMPLPTSQQQQQHEPVSPTDNRVSPRPDEGLTAYRSVGESGNVFSAIDPTAGRLPGNQSPQQPYPPQQHIPNMADAEGSDEGDEDGYCELGDVGVVQGQRRDMSKRGSGRNSSKKGQCKQQ